MHQSKTDIGIWYWCQCGLSISFYVYFRFSHARTTLCIGNKAIDRIAEGANNKHVFCLHVLFPTNVFGLESQCFQCLENITQST